MSKKNKMTLNESVSRIKKGVKRELSGEELRKIGVEMTHLHARYETLKQQGKKVKVMWAVRAVADKESDLIKEFRKTA